MDDDDGERVVVPAGHVGGDRVLGERELDDREMMLRQGCSGVRPGLEEILRDGVVGGGMRCRAVGGRRVDGDVVGDT